MHLQRPWHFITEAVEQAAQMILGEPVALLVTSVAVNVWLTGKAKVRDDVRHYWVAGRS